jgi:peptide/nickel transport system permease protein
MKKIIFRRTLNLFPTFVGVVVILFFLYISIPGDFVTTLYQMKPKDKIELRKKYHLDQPKDVQFIYWIQNITHGDMGEYYTASTKKNSEYIPVAPIIKSAAVHTIGIILISMVVSTIISIRLCVVSIRKKSKKVSKFIWGINVLLMSLPGFLVGSILVYSFEYNRYISDFIYYHKIQNVDYNLRSFIIPILVINMFLVPKITKQLQPLLSEVLDCDYIRTVKAYGFRENKIMYKYALKNAAIPLITVLGTIFSYVFSETVIIEAIMQSDGLGALMYEGIRYRQYNLVMSISMVIIVIVMLGMYFSDILYYFVDPRIKYRNTLAKK